jgi:hypothetical protein
MKVANNIIQMTPKALQHSADELKPSPARSPGANGSGGFKRRF